MKRLLAVGAVALASSAAALAHGPIGGVQGYVSTISALEPNVLGVNVAVIGGDDRLRLANYSGKTIDVLGYDGEPFLRFSSAGVYENLRSPAAYLSRVRDPAKATVPRSADPKAAPRWHRIGAGTASFVWHDHRIHWTRTQPPKVVRDEPDEIHRIFSWRVPGHADGKPFAISGFLGYAPVAHAEEGGGTSAWLVAGVIGGSLLAAAALWAGARRSRRRAPAS
jgi:hypothetical protein